jgi:hypothetical protein
MDFIANLKTVAQARNLMSNALKKGRADVYQAAFRRLCEIEGKDHTDPVVMEFWKAIAALEQLLFEEHGKIVRASRTRQKAQKEGEVACLSHWALRDAETRGFEMLVGKGLADLTGESIIMRHASRFSPEVFAAAKARLIGRNIMLPETAA